MSHSPSLPVLVTPSIPGYTVFQKQELPRGSKHPTKWMGR